MNPNRHSQRGNVLFIILIAIGLFAALSVAISNSGNSGMSAEPEKIVLGASQIKQYFASVRKEVMRMKVTNGCGSENFDWRNNHWKRLNGSPSNGILQGPQTPKAGCAIFKSRGGPISDTIDFEELAHPEYNATMPSYSVRGGHIVVNWMDKEGSGTDATDVGMEIRGLKTEICSYLLDPETKPSLFHEGKSSSGGFNLPPPDYSGSNEVIDEPGNSGEFFAHHGISTGPACDVGTIILAR